MGSFVGHAAPGCFFFFFGLWCWLQSLSDLKTFSVLRTSPFCLSVRGMLAIAGSIFTMIMELVDILRSENANSHTEHLWMDVIIMLIGVIELLILFRVIWSPFYPYICGILWTFIGLFFTVHAQDNLLGLWMHQLNIGIVVAMGIMWFGALAVGFQASNHVDRVESPNPGFLFWRGKTTADLNGLYTNAEMYRTPFMSGLGWFGMLLGCWWWQMAISLFLGDGGFNIPEAHVPHTAVILLGQNILYVTIICIAVNEIAKRIDDSRQTLRAVHHKEEACSV